MWHLSLNQLQRLEMGIGLIEPVYPDTVLKENIENAKAQTAYKQGYPTPLVQYGSDKHAPHASMKAEAEVLAKKLADERTIFAAYPYHLKVETLSEKMGKLENIENTLLYSTKLQAAVLGRPLSVLLQTGEDVEQLIPFFEAMLATFQKALKLEEIINYILKMEKIDDHVTVVWKEFTMHSARERIMQISRLGKVKILDISDPKTRDYIKKVAELPTGGEG